MIGVTGKNSELLPYDLIDLDPTSVDSYKVAGDGSPVAPGKVVVRRNEGVSSGDVLKVRIFEPYEGGVFPTVQRAGADLGVQRVTESGVISVPFVGRVQVAGLTMLQIQDRITEQVRNKAPEAQVAVELVADHTHQVTVSGEVKRPGRLSLLDGIRSIRDAIDAAGGPAVTGDVPAAQFEIILQRGESVIYKRQYSELLTRGDDLLIEDDQIVVRLNTQRFTALGAVLKAGNIDINKPGMTLLEALGAVGGLSDERANKTGVFIFRLTKSDQGVHARSRIFRLNLMEPVSIFIAQQFEVRPGDVIYVSNAPLYEYNKLLTQVYRTISSYSVLRGVTTTSSSY